MSRNTRKAARSSRQMVQQGGGREVALPPEGYAQQSGGYASDSPAGSWFGPLTPMRPTAPIEVAGRRTDYPSGYNLSQQPRAYEAVTFEQLRQLADGWDLLRLTIETRKDQMARLNWRIVPIDEKSKDPTLAERAKKYTLLLRRPDGENFWKTWLRSVLEDLLVIDAPAIYIRRTLGGEVLALDQIDGGTIKRVIDDWGRTPEAPYAAYQQVLKGLPAVNYTKRDLIYRPRNLRSNKFYGYSPVEQIIMTIQLAVRRQLWQLSYFTDGNLPDSLIGVPSTWTPDQIRIFQDWFDSMLSGNTQKRRGATFVPGEVAKSYVPTKEAEIFGEAEQWMARVVSYAFGVSHQPLVKEVNRATAETAQEQAVADGLAPTMNWVKELIDGFLMDEFQETDLEFQWDDEKEMDPKTQAEIVNSLADSAKITINQAREQLGLEPDPAPEANLLGYKTANGWVPLDQREAIKFRQQMESVFPAILPVMADEDPAAPSAAEAEGDEGSADVAADAGGEEEGARADAAKSFSALRKTHGKSPADQSFLSVNRPVARKARRSLQRTLEPALEALGKAVGAQVARALETASTGVSKADSDDAFTPLTAGVLSLREIDDLIEKLNLSPLDSIIDAVTDDLGMIAKDSSLKALAQIGVEDREQLVNIVSRRAVGYARERAAELVGKRVLEDGTIIDNPDARWAITQSTRDMVRETLTKGLEENLGAAAIVAKLESSYAFSPERADMISRTEIATANSEAAMETYEEAQEAGVSLKKEWLTDDEPCDVCKANADQGPIPLDEAFESGDETSPAHPNCECAVIPVVED